MWIFQFKTLVSRWLEYTIKDLSQDYEIGVNIARLDDLTARDSYIWSYLQDVESSSCFKTSWSNMDTNKLFLSSLNVDARNIVSIYSCLVAKKEKFIVTFTLFKSYLKF